MREVEGDRPGRGTTVTAAKRAPAGVGKGRGRATATSIFARLFLLHLPPSFRVTCTLVCACVCVSVHQSVEYYVCVLRSICVGLCVYA